MSERFPIIDTAQEGDTPNMDMVDAERMTVLSEEIRDLDHLLAIKEFRTLSEDEKNGMRLKISELEAEYLSEPIPESIREQTTILRNKIEGTDDAKGIKQKFNL